MSYGKSASISLSSFEHNMLTGSGLHSKNSYDTKCSPIGTSVFMSLHVIACHNVTMGQSAWIG